MLSDTSTIALSIETNRVVVIIYTNYRGETNSRKIIPQRIWFGETSWHHDAQWLIDAIDVEKEVERSFAIRDIQRWEA